MTSKVSLATAGVFGVLGLVVGGAAIWLASAAHFTPPPSPPHDAHKHAKIKLTSDSGTCDYKTVNGGGSDVSNKFPLLNKTNGDDIDWIGQDTRPHHGNPRSLTVAFSASPFTSPGPFTSTTNAAPSGPIAPGTTEGDYPYSSVTFVDDGGNTIPCSNATDPGVHVDP